ncbi:MAG: phosphatase PAP2 family protein [bacterium]|nr:phosphatase PAP2 family protein [bacterium]
MRRIGTKMLLYSAMAILFFLGYRYVAEVTAVRSVETSFLTPIDGMIPFIPEFVFPYMSLYALFWLPVIVSRNITLRDFATIIVATAGMFAVAFTVYAIIPSRYPRPEVCPDTSFVYYILAKALYAYDLPNNTLPSTHAAVVAILLSAARKKFGRRTYAVYALWGASILLSTVTVKQHFVVDLVSGIVLGVVMYAVARRIVGNARTT